MTPMGAQRHVSTTDPPLTTSGMTLLRLDTSGRLEELNVVPPQFDPPPQGADPAATAAAPDWALLFNAAGLKMDGFQPAAPQWTPRGFADTRAAWEGPLPARPGAHVCLRVRSTGLVDAFHAAALANGGSSDGEPGLRAHERLSGYYAAFIKDLDGNRIEAVTFVQSAA